MNKKVKKSKLSKMKKETKNAHLYQINQIKIKLRLKTKMTLKII